MDCDGYPRQCPDCPGEDRPAYRRSAYFVHRREVHDARVYKSRSTLGPELFQQHKQEQERLKKQRYREKTKVSTVRVLQILSESPGLSASVALGGSCCGSYPLDELFYPT
jgi:hypothetical protein